MYPHPPVLVMAARRSVSNASQKNPLHFKLVLLGDEGVGKSCIAQRFVRRQFNDHSSPTIGASFFSQTLCLDDNKKVKLDIWDTAGQERYHSLAPIYYRGASAAVVVYDLTRQDTFEHAQKWVDELRQQVGGEIAIALAGNKSDMAESHITVTTSVAQSYADDADLMFFETSAKTGDNIEDTFLAIARKLCSAHTEVVEPSRILLDEESGQTQRGCCSSFSSTATPQQ
ncbi:ras-related protein Rab-5B-like [Bolinopsis microptera]|uniref:ras-related protein Rab-5B-like n=1 Tax=Bolinopsis microptera TaxID=2820187 RepID=UPI003079AB20